MIAILGAVSGVRSQSYFVWEQTGSGFTSRLGSSLASAGDVNGDGVPDLVSGAPWSYVGSVMAAGQAKVLSGMDGSILLDLAGTGSSSSQFFGSAVAGIGDADGDGHDDVAVGAPGSGGNYVAVISGIDGGTLLLLTGTGPASAFGSSVAGPGDLNADGVPDVLVGAQASVTAFSGLDGTPLLTILVVAASIAGLGDVDADGVPDFIVGAPWTVPYAGQAVIYSGATGASLQVIQGASGGDYLGMSVAGTGDLTGDGVPDVVVGAPQQVGGVSPAGPGYARVHSGADGTLVFSWTGLATEDHFGESVASAGDVDGDGFPDIVVGAPRWVVAGFYLGPGYARVYSGSDGSLLAGDEGSAYNDAYGQSVSGAGDTNGDGFADWAVGAPFCCSAGSGIVQVRSYAGIPPGSFLFDVACPGSAGIAPLIQTGGGSPTVGNGQFSLLLSNALGNTTALLLMGASASSWGGIPLPVDLSAVGMPGCFLLVSPDVVVATTTSPVGGASVSVPIPPIPSPVLIGAQIHFQWYVVDPGPLALPGALTKRLRVLVLP